jgi:hypothetical protein
MKRTEFIDAFADRHEDEEILRADGLDEACVGWTDSWNGSGDESEFTPSRTIRLIYDIGKVIDILQERDGMTYEDAVEFFDFNIAGAYFGKGTPIFINNLQDTNEYCM